MKLILEEIIDMGVFKTIIKDMPEQDKETWTIELSSIIHLQTQEITVPLREEVLLWHYAEYSKIGDEETQ